MRDPMLIIHFVGLAMGVGSSFAGIFLRIASSKMEKSDGQKFRLNTFALSRMGHIGFFLLIISGIYLMTPFWSILASSPLLIGKLILVLVLAVLIGIISSTAKKAKKGDSETQLKKISWLGMVTFLTALIIVILAVYVFH